MPHYDLREYLGRLEEAAELRRVEKPVDSNLEVGAIVQRIAECGGPALHFTAVSGASDGSSLVGALMNRGSRFTWSKVAHLLELDPAMPYVALVDEAVKRIESPVKPMLVRSGPCKENGLHGKDINLDRWLAPWIHPKDGGRCISSWGFTVVQEPGSNFVAWEVIPHLVIGPNQLAAPMRHGGLVDRIFRRYCESGAPMPFAIVLGASPVGPLAASFRRRRSGTPAPDIAGGLQRAALQMVKCETSDLMVPATAEMVLEGVVLPEARVADRGFPGSFGYQLNAVEQACVWEVRAITHRNQPILPFASWGVPITECHLARSLDCDVQLKQEFIKRGTPVRAVYSPPWLAGSAVAVSTKVPFTAFSQSIAGIVRSTEATRNTPYIFVCDDDIDVTNPIALFHALVTKCRPGRDSWQIQNTGVEKDAPYADTAQRRLGKGAAMIFDCTWPLDWDRSIAVPPRVSFDQCYPKELQERVIASWSSELGFPAEAQRPAATV